MWLEHFLLDLNAINMKWLRVEGVEHHIGRLCSVYSLFDLKEVFFSFNSFAVIHPLGDAIIFIFRFF